MLFISHCEVGIYSDIISCDDHATGTTRPTRNTYDAEPTSAITLVIANAQKKLPVRSTTYPAMIGAEIPARLPQKFSSPVHFPAVCGPARICVIVQRFGEHKPSAMHEKMRIAIAMV